MTQEEIEKQMWVNYDEGYKAGCSETINKACEWIEKFTYNSVVTDNIGEREKQAIIIAFKEYMEERE